MRNLKLNQSTIQYKLFLGKTESIDDDGYATGTFVPGYGDPQTLRISVSANKGDTTIQQFGNQLDYDRTLITADMSCPIVESTLVIIDGAEYSVKAVAKSLNQIQIAIKRKA